MSASVTDPSGYGAWEPQKDLLVYEALSILVYEALSY
jgi:hypothetical protein